jgi:site-specific recombinase XerD
MRQHYPAPSEAVKRDRSAEVRASRLVLFQRVKVVEPLQEQLVIVTGKSVQRTTRKSRAQVRTVLRDLDLRWHDLRHEAASRWREQGLDLREIQLLLGHSTLLMTQRYLNVSDDDLATAMNEKMWKRA